MAIYKSKTVTKDGRQYFFRIKYKDIMGEVHDYTSRKYKTLKEATQEEALYRIKVQNQEICTTNITLNQIFNEYILMKSKIVKKQSLNRIKIQYSHISIIGNKKINDINVTIYNYFINSLNKKNFSSKYNNKILGLFKRLIIYSAKYYNTSESILKFVEPFKNPNEIKKEMLFYTYEQFSLFIKCINDPIWKLFFEILYFMGLRQGELQALTWKDIDFNKNTLSVNKTLTTKIKGEKWTISSPKTKNSNRVLPLPKLIHEGLKSMYNEAIKYNDFNVNWFVFGNSIPFKETTICNHKNNYCKIAGLTQIRIHDFRHSCASLLINKGASISLVSKYLGHSNITMTLNTYTHMYKSELDDMISIIDNM